MKRENKKITKEQENMLKAYIPALEKKICISEKEYYSLVMIKGKYKELKSIIDKLFLILSPNEIKNILDLEQLRCKNDNEIK